MTGTCMETSWSSYLRGFLSRILNCCVCELFAPFAYENNINVNSIKWQRIAWRRGWSYLKIHYFMQTVFYDSSQLTIEHSLSFFPSKQNNFLCPVVMQMKSRSNDAESKQNKSQLTNCGKDKPFLSYPLAYKQSFCCCCFFFPTEHGSH